MTKDDEFEKLVNDYSDTSYQNDESTDNTLITEPYKVNTESIYNTKSINDWSSKLMTLMKCISVVSSDSTLRYGHFVRDLCSIQDYSSTCIQTNTV